jgi:hypothetical protein
VTAAVSRLEFFLPLFSNSRCTNNLRLPPASEDDTIHPCTSTRCPASKQIPSRNASKRCGAKELFANRLSSGDPQGGLMVAFSHRGDAHDLQ